MIHVVEVPWQGRPLAWFAFDEADLIGKIRARRADPEREIHQIATARELLAASGAAAQAPPDWIVALAARHGWEMPLYRADALLEPGHYQREPVSALHAHLAALAAPLQSCRVHPDDASALEALHGDPLYRGREGFYAHMALRAQLIALEVLADDL
ncbi:MAG: hypothetical protein AMXMBFR26_15810 [Porticoccaceae bacterium]